MKDYPLIIDKKDANEENILVIKTVVENVPIYSYVLDIGCNCGWLMEELVVHKFCNCWGIDNSVIPLSIAKARGMFVQCADGTNIPHPDGKFNVVTVVSVFQQCSREECAKMLRECFRVLIPGGMVVGVAATPEGGWGVTAVGKSPYVFSVFYQNEFPEVKPISQHAYLFKIPHNKILEVADAVQK